MRAHDEHVDDVSDTHVNVHVHVHTYSDFLVVMISVAVFAFSMLHAEKSIFQRATLKNTGRPGYEAIKYYTAYSTSSSDKK